uniref:Uncharacterized protein n=1 Tax=Rhizophora mucronata TaxID=61149 RepID=A0A2P2PZE4_RHIMU
MMCHLYHEVAPTWQPRRLR